MKALFLFLAFALAAAGLRCPADRCHDAFGHDEPAGQSAGHPAQDDCDCLGCHPTPAIDFASSDAPALECVPAGFVVHTSPIGHGLVYRDGPFHPPRA